MFLLVGLGNPGKQYQTHRHNVGFMVLDALSSQLKLNFAKSNFGAELANTVIAEQKVLLAKPQEYMNCSGRAVRSLSDYYQVPHEHIVVVHDEVDLPFGAMKWQQARGHGGHNGVRSIIAELGDNTFCRLRVGVGRPPHAQQDVADFVLAAFSAEERKTLQDQVLKAAQSLQDFVREGLNAVQQRYH